jgi:hypothetical protein
MSSTEEEEFRGELEEGESNGANDDPGEEGDEDFVADQEGDDDESEDEPLEALKSSPKRAAAKVTPNYAEDSDDESEDDVPLVALVSAKKKNTPKKNDSGKKKAAAKAPPKKKKSSTKVTLKKKVSAVSTASNKSYDFASAALYGTECDKGLLIQRLLCRWWYAITWPDLSALPDKPPKNYDSLDGFPGVYICTSGDQVGKIKDLRDAAGCPSFQNFAKKTSEELRTLLLKALEEQKKQLVAAEGTGTATEKELDRMIKWATKLNTNKAEKEAGKVLKAHGLALP